MGAATIVLRNAIAGLGAQAAIKVLSFGFSVLIVRQLGADQFGQYAAVLAFGATFVFLADLGLGVYVVREVSLLRASSGTQARITGLFGDSVALRFSLAVMAALMIVLAAWLTNRPPAMIVAIALGGVGLIVYSIQGAIESVLAGFERLDLAAFAKVANQVVFVTLGAVALIGGIGYHGLVLANVAGAMVMAWLCWRAVRRLGISFGSPTVAQWPALLRSSAPFAVIAGTLGLSYKFDSVLLNLFRSDAETGIYNAAYSLVFAAVFLSNALNTALYPTLTRHAARDPGRLSEAYGIALRYLMSLSLPIAVGGWVLSDQIVALLFGDGYAAAAPALTILILVVPLMFATEFLGYVVVIAGAERTVARSVLVSTGINIGCNLLLVPWFGVLGAAVMTVVTEAVLLSQYVWFLRSTLAQIGWERAVLRPLVAAILMGLAVSWLRDLPVVVSVPLAGFVYGGLLFLFGVFGLDEMRALQRLRGAPAPA
jgi:O-antigen/teichoic acid export membrane protein